MMKLILLFPEDKPKLLFKNIAEVIEVKVNADLKKYIK